MLTFLLFNLMAVLALSSAASSAQYADWPHSGSLYILTTPEGASLPATSREQNFPLLVRLHKDWFDFSQATADGHDIRFATKTGEPLPFQIEHWDPAAGAASIWVRIPVIEGNSRQEIRMYWGQADADSESNGAAVFNAANGYLSVWHMNDAVDDVVGTLTSTDTGTTMTTGVIGGARQFSGGQGITCGDQIVSYPSGSAPSSTQAWFRPRQPNSVVIGWGNEQAQGKIILGYRSPPHVRIDAYFSDGNVAGTTPLAADEWVHVVHTYQQGDSRLYVNGVLDAVRESRATPLSIKRPARLWIGGWYNNYSFVGDIDETRVSRVARSADWIRLEYENQKPLQRLVGPILQPGTDFSVSDAKLTVAEGQNISLSARAGGAQKVYWILKHGDQESIAAVDRLRFTLDAGRVKGDQSRILRVTAVYAQEVKTIDIPVTIKEAIPEPIFTLQSPNNWDGRQTIEVVPQLANLKEMQAQGAGELSYRWNVSGLATIKETAPGRLLLQRAQNSGELTVTATLSNGGDEVSSVARIKVQEPEQEAWVERTPETDEKPVDNQFYARNEKNEATLYYKGTLSQAADAVFLKVYADDRPFKMESQKPAADRSYAFAVKLKPGLIKYRVEFGSTSGGTEKIQHSVGNLVCGDAYIIDGQSNALATDTREESPPETSDWIRSYGSPKGPGSGENLWCNPVWKARNGEQAELGYWGMELATRLVKSQQIPICIINGAVGGTRIDQHQRNEDNPTDLGTIYGRLLWRVRQARLTHGIRAILWHQGENDQGADGPDGGYGWETYEDYFVAMSASWKRDFPNVQHYYIFQIWPNACSMGNGNGDMLREVQRTLPRLYSNLDIMSTLGITPPGGCHYPLEGWAEFARLIQPLIERDIYQKRGTGFITPPNLRQARYANHARDVISLEFDQPVAWDDSLRDQFYLAGAKGLVASGTVSGNVVTLKLNEPSVAEDISYLKETSWNPARLLRGRNGIAALTFCQAPLQSPGSPSQESPR